MALSPVTICSNALLKLGDAPIASFSDDSDRARLCANLWPNVRDAVLRMHPWNCCVKREVLAPDSAAPAWGYQYKFTLPGDWLRTISIGPDDRSPDYQTEDGKILCNESVVYLRYVYRNDDVSKWDLLLIEAMTAAMAAEMAYTVTESTSLMQAKQQELEYILRRARSVDAQENPPMKFGTSELILARYRSIP